jgi:hypothetical protein
MHVSIHDAAIAAQMAAGAGMLLIQSARGLNRFGGRPSAPLAETVQPDPVAPPVDRSIVHWFLPT